MTVNNNTGAAFSKSGSWSPIGDNQAERNVHRLQTRIVKAVQENRWGRVKALQRLLTCSLSGKILAVKRVTENQGSRSPGVDGAIWKTARDKAEAIKRLRRRGYNPQPLRRIYIPKANGKKRPLGIPIMHDRAMQAIHLLALDPVVEVLSDPNSYGFRKERSVADAIEQCFIDLGRKPSAQFILEADIKACFDQISHAWLVQNVPMDKSILMKWLKAGFMEKGNLYPTGSGTPQGGICSPTLANIALNGLEKTLLEKAPRGRGGRNICKVNVVRYADDFIVTSKSKEWLEKEAKPEIEKFLNLRGLELSQEKTLVTHISEGFDFLGHHIRKYDDGKLLTTPAKKNVRTFLRKAKKLIATRGHLSPVALLRELNPVITGWATFYKSAVSKETFAEVDNEIFWALWRWAKRRHPNKGSGWIKNRYFGTQRRKWVFRTEIDTKQGKRIYQVRGASDTPIVRHKKVKNEANPYDPAWDDYFKKRRKDGGKLRKKMQPR